VGVGDGDGGGGVGAGGGGDGGLGAGGGGLGVGVGAGSSRSSWLTVNVRSATRMTPVRWLPVLRCTKNRTVALPLPCGSRTVIHGASLDAPHTHPLIPSSANRPSPPSGPNDCPACSSANRHGTPSC
jgi:hypothetical protein